MSRSCHVGIGLRKAVSFSLSTRSPFLARHILCLNYIFGMCRAAARKENASSGERLEEMCWMSRLLSNIIQHMPLRASSNGTTPTCSLVKFCEAKGQSTISQSTHTLASELTSRLDGVSMWGVGELWITLSSEGVDGRESATAPTHPVAPLLFIHVSNMGWNGGEEVRGRERTGHDNKINTNHDQVFSLHPLQREAVERPTSPQAQPRSTHKDL